MVALFVILIIQAVDEYIVVTREPFFPSGRCDYEEKARLDAKG